jgi:hypothetical protein
MSRGIESRKEFLDSFVREWNLSGSRAEVAERMGISIKNVITTIVCLKRRGIRLSNLRTRKSNGSVRWGDLRREVDKMNRISEEWE